MKNKFNCLVCGLCCRNISLIRELEKYDLGNGVCKYLDVKKNICKIYENRPEICNVEKKYDTYYFKFFTEEKYLELNYKGCYLLWKKKIKKM